MAVITDKKNSQPNMQAKSKTLHLARGLQVVLFLGIALTTTAQGSNRRWPSCPQTRTGTIAARKALLREGLELGLERLWRRIAEPPRPNKSSVGNEPNILSILGARGGGGEA